MDEFILSTYPNIKGQEGQSFGFGKHVLGKVGGAIMDKHIISILAKMPWLNQWMK